MLTILNLTKKFGKQEVLKGVDLQVKKGEILGFVGANGAGKTTTLHCITGLEEQDGGNIVINNIPKTHETIFKKQFYFIPDTFHVFKNISAYDWIHFVLKLYEKLDEEKLDYYIKAFEMQKSIYKPMGTYSYGMLHKMALIAAFTISPPIIIMDEPLNGLDPFAVLVFKNCLKDYVENGGTVIFSTHLLDVVEKICESIAFLKEGRIVLHESVESLLLEGNLETTFMEIQANEV
ncbi:ABC transporter ATP-binding protein [Psychrobacillus sp. Sa2BUA9]|uniref:ABC transporter ATP-binding protein n=1 Tax=Psychrobacillus faecigallinarum TaxID=2762235 RepID=A0ABR8R460_9BACI|nr:ABC transporter ATP-binding protein [Psychrobacillus faecigallinarum]MBD7942571.1 ABC transporter ATP-binding protein [Psychrobacillus faecigallinarum]